MAVGRRFKKEQCRHVRVRGGRLDLRQLDLAEPLVHFPEFAVGVGWPRVVDQVDRAARQLVAARIMGAIYRRILDRIETRDYDVFSSVVRIPRPERALIAGTTWLKTVLGG